MHLNLNPKLHSAAEGELKRNICAGTFLTKLKESFKNNVVSKFSNIDELLLEKLKQFF